jgi:outer membrane protein assembly factor BamB
VRLAIGLAVALLSTAAQVAADDEWPTYHQSNNRAGVGAAGSTFKDVRPAWTTGPLDGAVYAEPLYVGGRVLVATENNTIYAFDAASGSTAWQTHLADPVSSDELPCGNIEPVVGITGTPSAAGGVVYAAAFVRPLHYELYAVDVASGGVQWHRPLDGVIDPPAASQRGALSVASGRVYVPFGGRYGDCGNYHGQVIAASVSDPNAGLLKYTTPSRWAGMWAPGGMAIADDGLIYTVTGNGDAAGPEGRSEAVISLSPMLDELDVWQPSDWRALDDDDTDIGSVAPALLPDLGLVFQSGKNGRGYLLRAGRLGGVGGQLMADDLPGGCSVVFGGTAYLAPLLYLPCEGRVVALKINNSPPGFSLAWRGPLQTGRPVVGSPIVAAGAVWNIDMAGRLVAMDAASGAQRFEARLPGGPANFSTPTYGGGRIFVATGAGAVAFELVS